jgi:hypothetical protein
LQKWEQPSWKNCQNSSTSTSLPFLYSLALITTSSSMSTQLEEIPAIRSSYSPFFTLYSLYYCGACSGLFSATQEKCQFIGVFSQKKATIEKEDIVFCATALNQKGNQYDKKGVTIAQLVKNAY